MDEVKFQKLLDKIRCDQIELLDLQSFKFLQPKMPTYQIKKLCLAIARNASIRYLNLGDNRIGNENAVILANNKSIKILNLERNEITAEGAQALANNTTLTYLNLRHNRVGNKGALAFSKNTTLKSLYLTDNGITDPGIINLARNNTLITLSLSKNAINQKGIDALGKNTSLFNLDLSCNDLRGNVEALANNTTIVSLNLWNNKIIASELEKFAENTTLVNLNIGKNRYGLSQARISQLSHKILNRPKSRLCKTNIYDIDKKLTSRKERYLIMANNYLPKFCKQANGFAQWPESKKIGIMFEKLEYIKCSYGIIQYFQSKDDKNPCKLDRDFPLEISFMILSHLYPRLEENKKLAKCWNMAIRKLEKMKI